MVNKNAFIKLKMIEMGINNIQLAKKINYDSSYVSRILSGKRMPKSDEGIQSICQVLNIDWLLFNQQNDKFEEVFSQYLHYVFFSLSAKRKEYYNKIMDFSEEYMTTPYYIHILFVRFIQEQISKQYDEPFFKCLRLIQKIRKYLDEDFKELYATFYLGYLSQNKKYIEAYKICNAHDNDTFSNEQLKMMFTYYQFYLMKEEPITKKQRDLQHLFSD